MRSWLQVSTASVAANARLMARRAAPATLCAIVKSNAYGHGLVVVSRALEQAGIPELRFGVFSFSEAAALRQGGITNAIVVLGPLDDGEITAAADLGLECAVLEDDDIRRFSGRGLSVHVKFDTGVSRFGLRTIDADGVFARCADAGLAIAGVYSHLANAEDLDRSFTLDQVDRLKRAASSVALRSGSNVKQHIAASAAAMLWPETRLDMVRCGIALYGFWPSPRVQSAVGGELALTPALRWFAPIAQIRSVAACDPVGYGCDFVPERDSSIAVLPVGYADGLPRAAGGGKLKVRIGDQRAPIVGRICMNACMVDMTGTPSERPLTRGDTVELDVEDVARSAGTINYEILSRLPASLERRYE